MAKLPSHCEVFFISGDISQVKFRNEKAKRILGFAPKDDVSVLWRRLAAGWHSHSEAMAVTQPARRALH